MSIKLKPSVRPIIIHIIALSLPIIGLAISTALFVRLFQEFNYRSNEQQRKANVEFTRDATYAVTNKITGTHPIFFQSDKDYEALGIWGGMLFYGIAVPLWHFWLTPRVLGWIGII